MNKPIQNKPLFVVHRDEHKKSYTIVSNEYIRDGNLSLRAKGFLTLMLSLPPTWVCSVAGFVSISVEGEDAIRQVIKELEQAGHLKRIKIPPSKSSTGRIQYIYEVYERSEPTAAKQHPENQHTDDQTVDEQQSESHGVINPEYSKKIIDVTENRSIDQKFEIAAEKERVLCQVRENINYDFMVEEIECLNPYHITIDELDEIVEMIAAAICSDNQGKMITGEFISQAEIKRVMLKVNSECIGKALRTVSQRSDVGNVPAYLFSVLFTEARNMSLIRGHEDRSNEFEANNIMYSEEE